MSNSPVKLPYDPSTMTVVIIDDQDPIRKAIRRVLISAGFPKVLEFFDGSDALKAIAKESTPIDLIITDLYMRQVSGFQVLKKIRGQNYGSDIPIIVVTGEGSKEDIIKAVDLGADDYILKPFQISDIEKKVASVLSKYHSPPPLLKLLRQGERLMIEGQFHDALKLFEAAERLDSTSARAQHCKAIALDRMGHSGDAIEILRQSSSNNSTYYKNYATLADIYLKVGQKQSAIEALKHELELNPKQPSRQTTLAGMLHAEGDYLGALEHYREALKENPKMKDALLGMGKASDANDNQEKAIYYYKRARRHHPDLTRALELMVQSFESRNELRKAIPVIIDEIHQAPTRADARVIAAQLYSKFDEVDKALKILDDGLLRDPQSIALMKSKAKILLSANDPTNAAIIYQRVVVLEPSSQHHTLLGLALMHDRQYAQSVKSLQAALKDAQDRQRVLTIIAEVHKRSGNFMQALTILSIAKRIEGTIPADSIEADIRSLSRTVHDRRAGVKPRVGKKAS